MVEVSQRARDFQNAVVGTGAEAHLGHGMFEMLPRVVVDLTVLSNEAWRHLSVCKDLLVFEAFLLHLASCGHALTDFRRTLAGRSGSQISVFHRGYFDV